MTYSMLIYFMHVLYIFHTERETKKAQNFKILIQKKEYNWAISYQIKKGISFNIYKSAYLDNIA